MSATGFYYIYNNILEMYSGDILCAYSFNNDLSNNEWVPSGKTAVLTNVGASGDFFSEYGNGKFNGDTEVRIQGDFDEDRWTAFFVCQKDGYGNVPIFGQEVSNGYSGFSVGLNTANKLYISFYNEIEGFITEELDKIPADKNIMGAYKNNNQFGLYLLNPNTKEVYTKSVDIPFGSYLPSKKVFLGSVYGTQDHAATLFVDEFYLINKYISSDIFEKLSSGFYTNYSGSGITGETFCSFYTYESGINVPIYSGVTGYINTSGGVIVDICGKEIPIIVSQEVTGVVSGVEYVTITGETCYTVTGFFPGGSSIDYDFFASLGKNGVTQLYQVNDGYDIYLSDAISSSTQFTGNNYFPKYSKLNEDFNMVYGSYFDSGFFPQLYGNGLYQISGAFTTTKSGYYDIYTLSRDYSVTGRRILFTGFFNNNDYVIMDFGQTGDYISETSGLNGYVLPPEFSGSTYIFLNGQLLTSGIDYTGDTLLIDSDVGTNIISYIPKNSGFLSYSGDSGSCFGFNSKIAWGQSRVWFNGVRQKLQQDYVEISSVDYLSGDYIDVNGYMIYDNNNLFFE